MPFGVYTGQTTAKVNASRAPIGRRLLIVAESTNGAIYEPFLYDSKERALLEFKAGPMKNIIESGFLPFGVELMRVYPYQFEETMHAIRQAEVDWVYIDNFDVDSETLDLLSDFTEEINESGRIMQIILGTPVPKNEIQFRQLMGYIEGLSIPTEDGVLELGRQISIVLEQFSNAGVAYAIEGVGTNVGETIGGRIIDHPLEQPVSSDWLTLYAQTGISGFRVEQGQTVIAHAVNAIQTDSPYKQLFVTRALQWFISEWVARVETSIGESMNQALYLAKQETEDIVFEYLRDEVFRDISYTITFEEVQGEILCEFSFLPVFGIAYIEATGVAKVAR